jgi:hypothetical protein
VERAGEMTSTGARVAVLVLLQVIIGVSVLTTSEVACGAWPFCPVTTVGLWAGLFFLGLAGVSGIVLAIGRRDRAVEPPPSD